MIEPSAVAVLLNANAKQVSDRIQGAISHVVPPEDIFLSRHRRDARTIARAVLDRRYGTVFIGGGDGTFVGFVNEIFDSARPGVPGPGRPLPRFGMLKLGTGNAVADFVGASPVRGGGILDDLLRARDGEIPGTYALDLVETEGKRCPFAGFGIDAAIINDYADLNRRYGSSPFRRFASGGPGYAVAIAGKTAPHFLSGKGHAEVEIVNTGSPAQRVTGGGRPLGPPVAHGEVLYRGNCNVLACSTVPNFGFQFKFFPYAGRSHGKMQLRVSRVPARTVLANLPAVWKGKYVNDEDCFDFLCDGISVKFDRPMPFQIGGDAEGYRDGVSFGLARPPVELVSFNKALLH